MMLDEIDFPDKIVWFGYCESGKTFGTRDYFKAGTALSVRYQRGWDKGRKEIEEMSKIVNRGTCSYCGEEMDLALLDEDQRCPDCKKDEPDDDEPEICSACNGSGEGMYDGTRCSYCYGTGTTHHDLEEQEDRRDYERDR